MVTNEGRKKWMFILGVAVLMLIITLGINMKTVFAIEENNDSLENIDQIIYDDDTSANAQNDEETEEAKEETIQQEESISSREEEQGELVSTEVNGKKEVSTPKTAVKNGLYYENGKWYYYNNNEIDYNYAGVIEYEGTYYFVQNGAVDFTFNGVIDGFNEWTYVYIENGKAMLNFTGLGTQTNTDSGYERQTIYYFVDGMVQQNFTGLQCINEKWYYIQNGVIDRYEKGLVRHTDGNYYYVNNGEIDWGYTTIEYSYEFNCEVFIENGMLSNRTCIYNNKYIKNGKFECNKNGLECVDNTWYCFQSGNVVINNEHLEYYLGEYYYVNNQGSIDWGRNGLSYVVKMDGDSGIYNWFYILGGKLNRTYTGLVYSDVDKEWRYYVNGTPDYDYEGLVYYNGGWYYVNFGAVRWYNSGVVEYQGGLYYVENGAVNWQANGVYQLMDDYDYESKCLITNGVVDTSYTGYYQDKEGLESYYISNGFRSNYTGAIELNGSAHYFVDGMATFYDAYLGYIYNDYFAFVSGNYAPWYTGGIQYIYDPEGRNADFYYVTNGRIDWNYTGVANTYYRYSLDDECIGKNYYLNGHAAPYNGYYNIDGTWYYFVNGDLSNDETLVAINTNDSNYYYSSYGVVNFDKVGAAKIFLSDPYNPGGFMETVVYWNRNHIDYTFNGFAQYANANRNGFVRIKNGEIDNDYTQLVYMNDGKWHFFLDGSSYIYGNALVEYYDTYYFTRDGILDFSANGCTNVWVYSNGQFESVGVAAIADGRLNAGVNGLFYVSDFEDDEEPSIWTYFENGLSLFYLNNKKLVCYNNAWYYVDDGVIDWLYSGMVKYNGNVYYVKDGIYDWSFNGVYSGVLDNDYQSVYFNNGVKTNYTGLVYMEGVIGSWAYFENGKQDFNYCGLVGYNGGWYYVADGLINWNYDGLVDYNGTYYYVHNGEIDWNYSGEVTYWDSDGFYCCYVSNGVLDTNYSGVYNDYCYINGYRYDSNIDLEIKDINGIKYLLSYGRIHHFEPSIFYVDNQYYAIKNGVVDNDYDKVGEYNNQYIYFENGMIDTSYNGTAVYDYYLNSVLYHDSFTFINGVAI